MKPAKPVCAAVLFMMVLSLAASPRQRDQGVEKKIDALLARMTLEEKVGQMTQFSGVTAKTDELIRKGLVGSLLNVFGAAKANAVQKVAVEESRLGIPLILGYDVLHGYKTIFPIPLAESSSWDPDLATRTAATAAREASAAGVEWVFAPMINVGRDPRWGRVAEGAGEDPLLGSMMAAARVKGFQGSDLSASDTVVACAKHYVGYGAPEAGRDYNSADMSRRRLRTVYLPPFRASVDAGAGTIMSAFNDLNGIPATADRFTLTDILRKEWGFAGFVVSDWRSIIELIAHGLSPDEAAAARDALHAGVDMDMVDGLYLGYLPKLVREGKVPESEIDQAVRRILRIKFKAGLFERPYTNPEREKTEMLTRESLDLALEAAHKSIILLKNTGNILPLPKDLASVALVGPLADDRLDPLGPWYAQGDPEDVVTVRTALRSKLPSSGKMNYAKGCEIIGGTREGFDEAVRAVEQSDAAVLVLGEAGDMSGQAASRAFLGLPGLQPELLRTIYEKTHKPLVLVVMSGRPLTISWSAEHIPAIVEAWFLGLQSGNAIADVLFGDYNPGGKTTITFPRAAGQIPIYYDHRSTGRPPSMEERLTSRYIDIEYTPLFPFGHGLSYTRFTYSNLELSSKTIGMNETLKIRADVRNAGDRAGDEIVQLYIRDLFASVTQPVRELKGFRRVALAPGESKTVEFELSSKDLRFWNLKMKFEAEPGKFDLWVGGSSVGGLLGSFELTDK